MELVKRSTCAAKIFSGIRPLLLQLPTPSVPNTLSIDAPSVSILALKSPRMMNLSVLDTAAIIDFEILVKSFFGTIRVCYGWGRGSDKCGMTLI